MANNKIMQVPFSLSATTVYPTRAGAFPAVTIFYLEDVYKHVREVQQTVKGDFGIGTCPPGSFWKHQQDVLPQ
jgi:hypothetical protein